MAAAIRKYTDVYKCEVTMLRVYSELIFFTFSNQSTTFCGKLVWLNQQQYYCCSSHLHQSQYEQHIEKREVPLLCYLHFYGPANI